LKVLHGFALKLFNQKQERDKGDGQCDVYLMGGSMIWKRCMGSSKYDAMPLLYAYMLAGVVLFLGSAVLMLCPK